MRVAGGDVVVRDIAGPPGATSTVILLHGWTATADANFTHCYTPLATRHRVIAFDQRGHGTGLRSPLPFRLADCADDAVAIATELGVERFVAVGYSMGGAVAQLVARRHPDRLSGMVLCATAAHFTDGSPRATGRTAALGGLAMLARVTPRSVQREVSDRLFLERKRGYWEPWMIELAESHDWRMVLEAGAAIGTFRSEPWLDRLTTPTAVVIPERDQVVPPARQRRLAAAIPRARTFPVDGDHLVAARAPSRFVPAVLAAIDAVTVRR